MDAPAHTTSAASKLEKIRAKLAAERSMDKLTGTANDGNNGHSADMQAAKRHSSGDKLELNEDNQTLEAASDDEDEDHNGGILGHTTNIVGSAVGGVTSLLSSAAAAVSGAVFSAAAVVLESVAGEESDEEADTSDPKKTRTRPAIHKFSSNDDPLANVTRSSKPTDAARLSNTEKMFGSFTQSPEVGAQSTQE